MSPLNNYYKTSHYLLKLGHTVLRHQLAVAPFAWQSNKSILLYFSPNPVPDFIQNQCTEAEETWHPGDWESQKSDFEGQWDLVAGLP